MPAASFKVSKFCQSQSFAAALPSQNREDEKNASTK
jgi:hypothetical protein